MRWKHVPEGEVIRKLSKGTRLHQEEPHGEAGGAGRGRRRAGPDPLPRLPQPSTRRGSGPAAAPCDLGLWSSGAPAGRGA